MPIPAPRLETRADVYALELRLESKAILAFLLDHDPRPFARDELAVYLGMKPHAVEVGIVAMQLRAPVLLSRFDLDGTKLGARFGFIPSGAAVRAAWANRTPLEPVASAIADTRALGDVDLSATVEEVIAGVCEEAREAGGRAYDVVMAAGRGDKAASVESISVAVYTHARKQGKDKRAAQKEADAVASKARAQIEEEERAEKEAARESRRDAPPADYVPMGGHIDDPDALSASRLAESIRDDEGAPVGDVGKQCSTCKTQWVGADVCPECGPTVEHPLILDVSPSVSDDAGWQMINDGTAVMREAPVSIPPEVASIAGEEDEPAPAERDASGQFQPRKAPKRRRTQPETT